MCGITAISRADESSIHDPAYFLKIAALAIEPRGTDATGFAWVNAELHEGATSRSWYWKTPDRARNAIRSAPLDSDAIVAIGHTRAATQGNKADNRNNHPVVDNGIMLVHNGIIYNDKTLYRELLGADFVPKAEVDSQVAATLLAHRAQIGADHVTDILSLIRGSAAFAWIESVDVDELHLARCSERPLTIAWTRKGDLVMSSTPETLLNLSLWANIRLRRVEEIDEGTYLRVRDGEIVERTRFELPKTTYGYKGSNATTSNTKTDKATTTSGQRWTKDGWVNRSDGKPVDSTDTAGVSERVSTDLMLLGDLINDNDDWDRHMDLVRRDANRREQEIAAWWAKNAPDDDLDDTDPLFPDEITVEPDGTIIELNRATRPVQLNWMEGDEFYASFIFPDSAPLDKYATTPDFWDGLAMHAEYRRDMAELLMVPTPTDDVLWDEWVDMWEAVDAEWCAQLAETRI